MAVMKPYDLCYFVNYSSCTDLQIYEIGCHACAPSYSFGPIVRNHYIFHYVLSGTGTLFLDGQEYHIHENEGFIIPSKMLAYYIADEKNPWNYVWLHLDGPKTIEYFQKAGLNTTSPVFKSSRQTNTIGVIIQQMMQNHERELYCIGKVYELFDCICELSVTRPAPTAKSQLSYIKLIINFIQVKYTEPIHMNDIANACVLERSYMTKMFKSATGRTPQDYLLSYRMKKACTMLEDASIPIQNIAYFVGYGDPFTFSKAFKRYVGQSPSEFRKKGI